ncbi:MAG: FG-GAP-like repeat-containing protein [Arenimonas sp.]|uniref:FG-GAP-like repeat-containing protein n=1 Tax=Arenimonas sp. TaxID=1872635 RepID=UPI0025C24830|nr:FG-GAP-like repeat-containing protein [Arenimonas sp.]MBW8369043.1 FG-GAP-like repeat-containing protein [Arenimonas sp.]
MSSWRKLHLPSTAWLAAALLLALAAVPARAAGERHDLAYAWSVATIDSGFGQREWVESGDFDLDGRLDLVTLANNWTDVRLVFLFQRADGQAPEPQEFVLSALSPGKAVVGLATADLNRDGRPEVLVSTTQGLVVARIGAGRTFANTSYQADRRVALSPPVAMDVDGDSHVDVVQSERSDAGNTPAEIVIRYGDGTGALPRTRIIPTGKSRFFRLEAGDINGDGAVDLVGLLSPQFPMAAYPVAILFGDGTGGFAGPDTSAARRNYSDVAVLDFNGDGRDDVMMANPSFTEFFSSSVLTESHVFVQDAGGQLSAPVRIALPARARTFDYVDLDGDGQRDLANVSNNERARIGMRLNRAGNFEPLREFAVSDSPATFGPQSTFGRDSVVYGDFNGDGITDAAVAGFDGRIVLMAGRRVPWATNVSPPGAPRAVTAVFEGLGTFVRVGFQPPASDGGSPITRYEVVGDPGGAVFDPSSESDPLSLSRRVAGQVNGGQYRYFVRAYNAAGPGPLSQASGVVQVLTLPTMLAGVAQVREPDSGTRILRFRLEVNGEVLAGGASFDARTVDGTAQAGLDYEPLTLTGIRIPEGGNSATVDVTVLADDLVESTEFLSLQISNTVGLRSVGSFGGAIEDSDGPPDPPTLRVGEASVLEGNSGSTVLRFPLSLSAAAANNVTFNAATRDISATEGVDYTGVSRQVVIPAGQVAGWFDVPVTPDVEDEFDEALVLDYTNVVGAYTLSDQAIGRILDDDVDRGNVSEPFLAEAEKGYVDIERPALFAETALLSGTQMIVPGSRQAVLAQDPTPLLPFDSLSGGVTWTSVAVPANPTATAVEVRVLAVAESATVGSLSLFVGPGNTPSAGAVACRRDSGLARDLCELVLRREPFAPETRYWALVQNTRAGGTGTDLIDLELGAVAMVPVNRELVASAQARMSGMLVPIRLGWDIPSLLPGERRLGYLMIASAPGQMIYNEPIRLHRNGAIDAPHVLAPGERRDVRLAAGDAQERIVFDVPVNAQSVTFTLEGQGEVSLFASHSAQPSSPTIAPAPARGLADAVSSLPGAAQSITLSGSQLKKGRWYLTPANRSATPASVTLSARVVPQGARPAFRPGHYFNPARPGHGLFLDFAGDQWLMVWYTYLQDGTATWYYTQAPAPAADQAQWPVDLLRVSRGETTRAVRVGSATLTVLEGAAGVSPKLAFGYNLDGDAGWETLTRLGDDQCPMMAGQRLDASGHWFSPEEPGHGFSAQILPNTEIYAAYVYDENGFPRWLIGQKDYQPSVTAVTLQMLEGFCPTCPLVPLQSRSVGVLTRTLGASAVEGGQPAITSIAVDAVYEPIFWGEFVADRPIFRLSARKGCD